MVTVSASVVTHNSAVVIEQLLDSLYTHTRGVELQVYVVDNASTDDTLDRVRASFPQAVLLPQTDNRGFGHGHNCVIPLLSSDYHLIINPDITFDHDVLKELCAFMEQHRDVVLTTPQIRFPDGRIQAVPRRAPKWRYALGGRLEKLGGPFRRWRTRYTLRDCPLTEYIDLTFCTGCFMLIRTEAFRAVGGFDEAYFLYCEDADLSRRLQPYGRLLCLPSVTVQHAWERGSSKSWFLFRTHMRSLWIYFEKWRKQPERLSLGELPLRRSVVMASFNGMPYIREQIASILPQLGERDELIVSDDGSTDGTREWLEGLAARDARVRVLDGPGRGVIRNFEHGLCACRGDLIFLSDQDDVWADDKLSAVTGCFDVNPDVLLCLHDATLTDAELNPQEETYFAQRGTKTGYWSNLWKNHYVGACMAFRRELLYRALPFPEGLPMHDQWLGLLAERERKQAVCLLCKPLILYRRHEGTATSLQHGSVKSMLQNRLRMWRALRHR